MKTKEKRSLEYLELCIALQTQEPSIRAIRLIPASPSMRGQGDFAASQNGEGQGQFLAPGSRVSACDRGELLHEADGHIGRFR